MALPPISPQPIHKRLEAAERGVKQYLNLFKFMAQQGQPLKSDSCLKDLVGEIQDLRETLNSEEYRIRRIHLVDDLATAQVMEFALKHPQYCQVQASPIDKNGKPVITILKAAFTLHSPELLELLKSLTSARCRISFEGNGHHLLRSSSSVHFFLERIQDRSEQLDPKDLDPDRVITITLGNNKQIQYTRADYYLLLLTAAPRVTEINWSHTDEETLHFLFQANAEYGWNDRRWISSQPHDLLLRMRQFLDQVLGARARDLYIYTHTDFLFSSKTVIVSASRLELDKRQFVQEMQTLLKACPHVQNVKIRQTDSLFHFTFTLEEFQQLLANPPEDLSVFFKSRPVRCKNGEQTTVDADFYYIMMKYLVECSMLDKFRKIQEIDLHDFDRQIVEHTHTWYKTGEFPRMSYQQIVKLIQLLQLFRSDEKWLEQAHEQLRKSMPFFTQDELRGMNWDGLKEILGTCDTRWAHFVQLGQEMYRMNDLLKLSTKVGCPQDLTTLTQPIYIKLKNGTVVEGSYTWLNSLEKLPDVIDQDHPISIIEEPVLTEMVLICGDLTSYPFVMLNRLHQFVSTYFNEKSALLPRIEHALQYCLQISLGNVSKKPHEYWKEVEEGLKKFPHALMIELAGSPIFWDRSEVEAFVAHGDLELQDLNTTVDVHLSVVETQGVQYMVRRIYKAQWKCFSDLDPTQVKLSQDPRFHIPDWAFQIYFDFAVNNHVPFIDGYVNPSKPFKRSHGVSLDTFTRAYELCQPIVRPFIQERCKQRFDTYLAQLRRPVEPQPAPQLPPNPHQRRWRAQHHALPIPPQPALPALQQNAPLIDPKLVDFVLPRLLVTAGIVAAGYRWGSAVYKNKRIQNLFTNQPAIGISMITYGWATSQIRIIDSIYLRIKKGWQQASRIKKAFSLMAISGAIAALRWAKNRAVAPSR